MTTKAPRTLKPDSQSVLLKKFETIFPVYTFLIGIFLFALAWLCFAEAETQQRLGESLGYTIWAAMLFIAALLFIGVAILKYIVRRVRISSKKERTNT